MKRFIILLMLLPLALSLPAAPTAGYSLAPVGVSLPSGSYGGLTCSVIFSPAGEKHFGDVSLSVDLAPTAPYFEGVALTLSTPVFRSIGHPFDWAFNNKTVWAPVLSAGVQYRLGDEWNVVMGLAPFSFQSTHFVYEFLSPLAFYSVTCSEWGWGIYIMRFSYFF